MCALLPPQYAIGDARAVQDVFPGHTHSSLDDPALAAAVATAAAQQGLLPFEPFARKCLHLDSVLAARFGVMLIGRGGTGKSSIISTLCSARNALQRLAPRSTERAAPDALEPLDAPSVSVCAINPKACDLGDLYGQHSDATGEWREGLISAAFRAAMAGPLRTAEPGADMQREEQQGRQVKGDAKTWVVLDGPVDSAWVENLNTVLDDSRTLCLASGERMQLSAQRMNVVFEVDDLSAASPATVSRCGMVFVPEGTLTWREVVGRWLAQLPACMRARDGAPRPPGSKEMLGMVAGVLDCPGVAAGDATECEGVKELIEFLMELFEKHLDHALAWLALHADEAVEATAQQRVGAMCLWLQVLLQPGGGWSCSDGFGVAERAAVSCMFAFAFVWGLGGGLQGDSRTAWDTEVRRRFDGEANFPERSGTVYEYRCNPERNFSFQVRVPARLCQL